MAKPSGRMPGMRNVIDSTEAVLTPRTEAADLTTAARLASLALANFFSCFLAFRFARRISRVDPPAALTLVLTGFNPKIVLESIVGRKGRCR